jgi:hypothetical protein
MPLAQADGGGHAEKMIAVDEVELRRESEHLRDRDVACGRKPRRGIIAMKPLRCGTKEAAAKGFPQRHACEAAAVGFEIARRGEIGLACTRSIVGARRVGNCKTKDFRAKTAIGSRLRDKNLMAAAGMPRRMHEQDGLAAQWQFRTDGSRSEEMRRHNSKGGGLRLFQPKDDSQRHAHKASEA